MASPHATLTDGDDTKLMVGPDGDICLPDAVRDRLGLHGSGGFLFLRFHSDGRAWIESASHRMDSVRARLVELVGTVSAGSLVRDAMAARLKEQVGGGRS